MNLQVSIKSIGYTVGTIGWLRKGLASGSLVIEEGRLQTNGNHGLWLGGERRQFLAAFNRYGLTAGGQAERSAIGYQTAHDELDRDPIFTDAAWAALMEIAQKWCDEQSAARLADAEVTS